MQDSTEEPAVDAPPGPPKVVGLALGLIYAVAVVGLAIAGSLSLQARRAGTEVEFVLAGQAGHLARSGIGDALNWFRVRSSQPVMVFDPRRNPNASPPVLETEDPEIGLVREVQIDGNYWGRYEVWRRWDADPDPERRQWREQMRVRDTSPAHGGAPGSVWKIVCVGYVFERLDASKPYQRYPNRVVSSQVLEVEIGKIAFRPSGTAALSMRDGGALVVQPGSVVSGGNDGAAITYPQSSPTPVVDAGQLEGLPRLAPVPSYDDSLRAVFGVDEPELRAMADMVVHDAGELPTPVPAGSMVFSRAGAVTLSTPLTGSGIVVHRGDLKLAAGADFRGLLYVDGSLEVAAPAQLRGAVIVTGRVTLGPGEVTLHYDPDVLAELHRSVGQYRLSGPLRTARSTE